MHRFLRNGFLLAVLGALALLSSGCKTEDELTSRPWNSPRGWESGLPTGLTEGR